MVFFFVKLPKLINESQTGSYKEVLKNKRVVLGVLGIFFYVGAEVAIGSYLINYFLDMNLDEVIKNSDTMSSIAVSLLNSDLALKDSKAIVGVFVTFYWTGAMIGRFVGAYLTRIIKPGYVLVLFASFASVLVLTSIASQGLIAMWSILAVGLFNSIMFPTIFTLAIDGLGPLKPKASGLLCTAIVGGAIIPPLFGYFSDIAGFKNALFFIIACYAYIYTLDLKVQSKIMNRKEFLASSLLGYFGLSFGSNKITSFQNLKSKKLMGRLQLQHGMFLKQLKLLLIFSQKNTPLWMP